VQDINIDIDIGKMILTKLYTVPTMQRWPSKVDLGDMLYVEMFYSHSND